MPASAIDDRRAGRCRRADDDALRRWRSNRRRPRRSQRRSRSTCRPHRRVAEPVAVDVPSASTSAEPQTTEVPTAAEEDFVSIYGDGALPDARGTPAGLRPVGTLQPPDAHLQQRGRPHHRQAAGEGVHESGAAPGAPGRQQLLLEPLPAAHRAQQPAAGQAEAGGPGDGPLRAQRHAGPGRHLRSGDRRRAAAARARTSARRSACGAGSDRVTSSCRCSGRARCATCSAWRATRRSALLRGDRRGQGAHLPAGPAAGRRAHAVAVGRCACAKARRTITRWCATRGCSAAITRSSATARSKTTTSLPDYLREREQPDRADRRDPGHARWTAADGQLSAFLRLGFEFQALRHQVARGSFFLPLTPSSTSRRARGMTACVRILQAVARGLVGLRRAVQARADRREVGQEVRSPNRAAVPPVSLIFIACFCSLSRVHTRSTTRSIAISVFGEANTTPFSNASRLQAVDRIPAPPTARLRSARTRW